MINSSFRDLAGRACGDWLTTQARIKLRSENADASDLAAEGSSTYQTMLARLVRQTMSENPGVTACYNGAQMSESVLRQILYPMFKGPQQNFERGGTIVKRYTYTPGQ